MGGGGWVGRRIGIVGGKCRKENVDRMIFTIAMNGQEYSL